MPLPRRYPCVYGPVVSFLHKSNVVSRAQSSSKKDAGIPRPVLWGYGPWRQCRRIIHPILPVLWVSRRSREERAGVPRRLRLGGGTEPHYVSVSACLVGTSFLGSAVSLPYAGPDLVDITRVTCTPGRKRERL